MRARHVVLALGLCFTSRAAAAERPRKGTDVEPPSGNADIAVGLRFLDVSRIRFVDEGIDPAGARRSLSTTGRDVGLGRERFVSPFEMTLRGFPWQLGPGQLGLGITVGFSIGSGVSASRNPEFDTSAGGLYTAYVAPEISYRLRTGRLVTMVGANFGGEWLSLNDDLRPIERCESHCRAGASARTWFSRVYFRPTLSFDNPYGARFGVGPVFATNPLHAGDVSFGLAFTWVP